VRQRPVLRLGLGAADARWKRIGVNEEIIWLGQTATGEPCAKVGDPDYAHDARLECRAFIDAIRKVCGREPEGARLVVQAQKHDFGDYYPGSDSSRSKYRKRKNTVSRVERMSEAGRSQPGKRGPVQRTRPIRPIAWQIRHRRLRPRWSMPSG